MATRKWQSIYQQLKEKILLGEYPAGSEFPTNLELMTEFQCHSTTIQNAVNALIREGLILSTGSTNIRRKVRPIPYRSSRRGDFLEEHGDPGKEVIVEVRILYDEEDFPDQILGKLDPPILFYHTKQYRDDILIADAKSYIPNVCDLKELRSKLREEGAMIYDSMKSQDLNPVDCQENLIVRIANDDDTKLLDLPSHSNIPVVSILRKVFEPDGRCIQICYLVDRADCYEFEYKFPLY